MKVTVSRDGVVIGVYQRKDIRAAVADGSLNLDDRYFIQGMHEWLPLSTLTKTHGGRTTEDESTPDGQHPVDRKAILEASSYLCRLRNCFGCCPQCTSEPELLVTSPLRRSWRHAHSRCPDSSVSTGTCCSRLIGSITPPSCGSSPRLETRQHPLPAYPRRPPAPTSASRR